MLLRRRAADSRSVRLAWFPAVPLLVAAAALMSFFPQVLRHRQPVLPAFQGSTSVYAVPLTGGPVREVLRLHGQWAFPVATHDGKALLLERPALSRTEIWRVPLDGTSRRLVGSTRVFRAPAPATAYVAGEQETRPASTGWRLDLHVRRGGVDLWSRRLPFPSGFPAASPDGATVAMVRMHLLELWTPDGHRVLARDAAQPEPPLWTHDGRAVVYERSARGVGSVVVRDVRTGAARALVHGRVFEPALSPDGKTVYVLGLNDAVSIPK